MITVAIMNRSWDIPVFYAALCTTFVDVMGMAANGEKIVIHHADTTPQTLDEMRQWVLAYIPPTSTPRDIVTIRAALGDDVANALVGGNLQAATDALVEIAMQQATVIAGLQSGG